MAGKTCVVTGGTSGIGAETAVRLAALGATVVVVGRDAAAGEHVRRRATGGRVEVLTADLSSLADVRRLAEAVRSRYRRIDVLVNNAGVIVHRPALSADGFELTFATNHLGPFLLTRLLTESLERAAPARIVNVASAAHKQVRSIPWDELGHGGPDRAYPLSKLLNVLFTAELARRLAGRGVTANCLHPGFVRTGLGRNVGGTIGAAVQLVLRFQPGAAAGARTPVYLASSPDLAGVTGGYFVNCRPARPSALARDPEAAARLWELSERMTGS
ncbi:SDR family oxidoreductase [Dactylosporangium sp. NPDC005572]|uniref:SDR family oxidoreductase n=1 Tax=Dactylosporangium sp. NPDC005572 TaxID=3156889 RepID=UPI00339FC788